MSKANTEPVIQFKENNKQHHNYDCLKVGVILHLYFFIKPFEFAIVKV